LRNEGGDAVGSPAGRQVTLHDVARDAGVSPTTASYILNGRSSQMRISADTEERVRRAAEVLGYRPNRSAQHLRTATTQTIGFLSDFVASGNYASRMLAGASAACGERDHLLVIGETEGDAGHQEALIEEMLARRVDAFIYATLSTAEVVVPEPLARRRTVLLNCLDRAHSLPAVLPHEYEGGRLAADRLLRAGFRDGIVLVGEEPSFDALAGREREHGIRSRLEEAGTGLAGTVPCAWEPAPAFDAVTGWLADGGRAQALICLNDRIAMGTYQALGEAGLAVPDDVAVISFDDSELAGWLRPRLTSIGLPYTELGATAVSILLADDWAQSGITRVRMPLSPEGRSVPGGT
jgi:LacI family transcriptional regulator